MDIPARAQVVIVGGGIIGCSIAYHLTRRGLADVVLLERKQLTCGTTWHAAGLVGQLRATHNLTRLARYSVELYSNLERETGQSTGFRQIGSIAVANNNERFEELKRGASMAHCFGVDVNFLSREEVGELWPLIDSTDLVGAIHLPQDGQTNPVDTTRALAVGAKAKGARIFEHVKVTNIVVEGDKAVGVRTDQGDIAAEYVVNAAGMWARELGSAAGATTPLHAVEHFYVVTEAIPGLSQQLPVLRDSDACSYFKEDAGKLLVGWFEPISKPWGRGGIPDSFSFETLPNDLEHIEPLFEAAARRVPILRDAGIQLFFNGPESFTPDGRYLLGETPEVKNLFVAAGFNSIGIQSAGGVGKVLADWIVDGRPPMDLWDVDVSRAMSFQRNQEYLADRTSETLGLLYAMHWPFRQPDTARGVRKSSLHDRLAASGACFGETAGWERPNWFASQGMKAEYRYSYGRQNWFECSAEEHRAVRERAGLFDQSSFGKYIIQGCDAEQVLNKICTNDVAVPVGKVVYTQWLNDAGGIESDLTVTREAEDRFLIVTSAATQVRDFAWLRRGIPSSSRAIAIDVTSGQSVLAIMGPRSREILSSVSDADLSSEAFPFSTSQIIDLGYARVRATRITYVGELGWELYVPTEFAQDLYDRIFKAGREYGLKLAGYHAMNSLRIEKAYRHWGDDLTIQDTPLEAGLEKSIAWGKVGGFRGRDALLELRENGVRRRLVQFALSDASRLLYGNEPIWRNGRLVGRTTSGMFGHTLGMPIGLGYVERTDEPVDAAFIEAGVFEIEVAGVRIDAAASLRPLYDPTNSRVRDVRSD